MTLTNFPNGVTSFGVPVLPDGISFTGQSAVYFVDGANGADGNQGTDPTLALKTIQAAVNRCNSGTGDTIFVAPGTYAENVVIADKDFITIIGSVNGGYARPDVVPTTGTAISITTSQGTVLKHLRFSTAANADVAHNEGNGFLFVDCVFDGSAQTATKGLLRLVGNAADDSYTASEGTIANCLFRGSGAVGLIFQHAANPSGVGVSDVTVSGCTFVDNTGADVISQTNTTGGGAGIYLNLSITDECQFLTSNKTAYINFSAGAAGDLTANNGLISNNYFASETVIASQILLTGQAKAHFAGNFSDTGLVNGTTFNN